MEKTELTVEDKYKRTMEEIESLKVELGIFNSLQENKMRRWLWIESITFNH